MTPEQSEVIDKCLDPMKRDMDAMPSVSSVRHAARSAGGSQTEKNAERVAELDARIQNEERRLRLMHEGMQNTPNLGQMIAERDRLTSATAFPPIQPITTPISEFSEETKAFWRNPPLGKIAELVDAMTTAAKTLDADGRGKVLAALFNLEAGGGAAWEYRTTPRRMLYFNAEVAYADLTPGGFGIFLDEPTVAVYATDLDAKNNQPVKRLSW